MNILLWVLQILLALWHLMGGMYSLSHYEQLTAGWANALSKPLWTAHGVFQIVCAILLVSGAVRVLPKLTPIAAGALALLALVDAIFPSTAQYAGFPGMLWPLIPGLVALFVAYGRTALKPF